MKKYFALYLPFVFIIVYQHTEIYAVSNYFRQRSDAYKYEILVPTHWQHDEITLSKKHIFVSFYNDAEIKVRAFFFDEKNIKPIIWIRKWNLREIDPLLQEIIETGNIRIRENIRDSLLIYEFRSKNKKVLQRTMICKKGDIVYIVDCKAPVRIFYRHENHFNIAFSSFKIVGENINMQNDNEAFKGKIQSSAKETKENSILPLYIKEKNHQRNTNIKMDNDDNDEFF